MGFDSQSKEIAELRATAIGRYGLNGIADAPPLSAPPLRMPSLSERINLRIARAQEEIARLQDIRSTLEQHPELERVIELMQVYL